MLLPLQVSAKDKATNKEQSIRIQSSGGLSEDQIQSMVRDAENMADKDKARKEMIEVRGEDGRRGGQGRSMGRREEGGGKGGGTGRG